MSKSTAAIHKIVSLMWIRTEWHVRSDPELSESFSSDVSAHALCFRQSHFHVVGGVGSNQPTKQTNKKRQNRKILHIKLYASSNFEYPKILWLMDLIVKVCVSQCSLGFWFSLCFFDVTPCERGLNTVHTRRYQICWFLKKYFQ